MYERYLYNVSLFILKQRVYSNGCKWSCSESPQQHSALMHLPQLQVSDINWLALLRLEGRYLWVGA